MISDGHSHRARPAHGIANRGHPMGKVPDGVSIGVHHRGKPGLGTSTGLVHKGWPAKGSPDGDFHRGKARLVSPTRDVYVGWPGDSKGRTQHRAGQARGRGGETDVLPVESGTPVGVGVSGFVQHVVWPTAPSIPQRPRPSYSRGRLKRLLVGQRFHAAFTSTVSRKPALRI